LKKALIITYYWPPSGGAGVQRWLKFAKHLRDFGWEPLIYTPENGEIPVIDDSLQKDIPTNLTVLKTPIWEPYTAYKRFIGQKPEEKINTGFLTESKKPKLAEKLAVWVRGNFFIPDARKYWVKPSVKYLTEYLQKNQVDVIISTGPPHSMHLIALELKRKLNIPWLADFRDPWTNIDYYQDLMLSDSADKKHHRLEQEVLENANAIVSVSPSMTEEFVRSSKFEVRSSNPTKNSKFITITNGFDEDDVYKGLVELDKKFSIAHIGTLVRSRNPEVLWKVLAELAEADKNFAEHLEIKLVGKVDISVWQSLEQKKLTRFVNKIDYLPHADVIKIQQQAQVLLLLINDTKNAKSILTGKFFEYLSAKRPIIGIGPIDGDAAKILEQTNAGKIVEYDDAQGLKQNINNYFREYRAGDLSIDSKQVNFFSRKVLTAELAKVLEKII
jgi:glycosyltransferase involved in cell wall biosynthesis